MLLFYFGNSEQNVLTNFGREDGGKEQGQGNRFFWAQTLAAWASCRGWQEEDSEPLSPVK